MSLHVTLPSGAPFEVSTQEEADFVTVASLNYQSTFALENPSDLADLDSIVTSEMLIWRWDNWMSREADWNGIAIDVRHYVDAAKKYRTDVRSLKKQLGIDKDTRRRTTGDGSVGEFITRILTAARMMGIHRSEQVDLVLELSMQLRTLCTIYQNSDEEERRLCRCTAADIIEWVNTVYGPAMVEHDLFFQQNVQSLWVGKL